VRNAKRVYIQKRDYWDSKMKKRIERCAEWSRPSGKPLITTECWSLVDYKDWPLLEWDWLKQVCELGIRTAAATGRWAASPRVTSPVRSLRHVAGYGLAPLDDRDYPFVLSFLLSSRLREPDFDGALALYQSFFALIVALVSELMG